MPKPTLYEGPVTEAERARAIERLIEREVKVLRHEIWRNEIAEYDYTRGGR
jgi:hypothetical protein